MNKNINVEEIVIKKGTIIKFQGIPFEVKEDTVFLGLQSNLDLALSLYKENHSDILSEETND